MTNLQIIGQVLSLNLLTDALGNSTADANGNTHQLTIQHNPIMDSIIAKVAQFKRVGTNNPEQDVRFCLTKDNGDYVLNISTSTAVTLAKSCGVSVNLLPLIAGSAKINGIVSIKEQGDEFTRRGSDEVEQYNKTHARLENLALSVSVENKTALLAAAMMTSSVATATADTQSTKEDDTQSTKKDDPFQSAIGAANKETTAPEN